MEPLVLSSPAKVNLYLEILGKRADGFHQIETLMALLGLADEMRFELRERDVTLECDVPQVPLDETNLAVRAARLLQRRQAGRNRGVHIAIRKRIPIGGGMGGGSSNAATTLRALNELWELNLSSSELHALAAELGSDVPFFLGPNLAVCRGRGEIIEPLDFKQSNTWAGLGIVLINPGFGVSTSWAYGAYAARKDAAAQKPPGIPALLEAMKRSDLPGLAAQLFNSLQLPVFYKYPILQIFAQDLPQAGAAGSLMSGSGATVFGLCRSMAQAEIVREKIAARFGSSLWVVVTSFAA
jgi:4-diphosphocytidyl-2-C-methyl-D-erythritol kinase